MQLGLDIESRTLIAGTIFNWLYISFGLALEDEVWFISAQMTSAYSAYELPGRLVVRCARSKPSTTTQLVPVSHSLSIS